MQGGSVVDFLLKENKYHLRGVTRKVEGDKAKALQAKGVEVVAGDVGNRADLERVFKGAWAVFAVTQFWEHGAEKEEVQGKLMADVAKEQGVKFFLYSSLPNSDRISGDKIKVPHFTSKARVEEHARTLGFEYTAFPQAACYLQNFAFFFVPKENNGVFELSVPCNPNAKIDWISVDDYGASVAAALRDPAKYNGKAWVVTAEHASFSEQLEKAGKVTGKKFKFVEVPKDVAKQHGHGELAEMFAWFEQYMYGGPGADITEFKKQYPQAKGFEDFLKASKLWQ